jgi:hypothetical protein
MRKFTDVYKEKQTKAFESNESKVLLDFKNVYAALLEKYECSSYNSLGKSAQNSFLFELNKYWNEGSGVTKEGEKFITTKSVILNEQSTVLQKKNFLKNKIKAVLNENLNGHDMKWKIYDILDEMYQQIKVSSINEILSVDMIDVIIREAFNDVANKFFDEIRNELNESCKPKKKLVVRKKSKSINESFNISNESLNESREEDFYRVAQREIKETEKYVKTGEYKQSQIDKLKELLSTNKSKFVAYYMRLTGATQWDLPDELFTYWRTNESLNELQYVNKEIWDEADEETRMNYLLSAIEDPDDAEKYLYTEFENLPAYVTSNMVKLIE